MNNHGADEIIAEVMGSNLTEAFDNYPAFSAIRDLMLELNLNQTDLAKLVQMHQTDISRLLSKRANPTVKLLEKIARATDRELVVRFEKSEDPDDLYKVVLSDKKGYNRAMDDNHG